MRELIIGGIYRHFKGGFYKVLNIAKDCDTLEDLVVYQNINTKEIWIRKKTEFLGKRDKTKTYDIDIIEQENRLEFIGRAIDNQKKSKWIKQGISWYCFNCSENPMYNVNGEIEFTDYCPECGCKMIGVEE